MTGDDDSVGSVGEEAVKLLAALQGWARENGSDYANAAAAAATGAASTASVVNEHIATGAKECQFCPICQVVSVVRATSPEVKQHLTSAATSLLQAITAGMAAASNNGGTPDPGTTYQRIDLEDDEDDY